MCKITDETTLEEFWAIMENVEENKWLDDFIKRKRKKGLKGHDEGTNIQQIDFLFGLLLNENLLEKYAKRYVENKVDNPDPDGKINTVSRNSYNYVTNVKSSKKDYFQQAQNLNENSTIKDVHDKICEILAGKDDKIEAMENLINELKEA